MVQRMITLGGTSSHGSRSNVYIVKGVICMLWCILGIGTAILIVCIMCAVISSDKREDAFQKITKEKKK